MSDTSTVVVIAIAAGLFFIWRRGRSVRLAAQSPQHEFDTATDIPVFPWRQAEQSMEDREVARAKTAAENIKVRFRQELEADHAASRETREKLEKADRYMRESGLAEALPKLWELVRHWPHWIKTPEKWTPPAGVTDIEGENSLKEGWTFFRWQGHSYMIRMVQQPNYVPDDYGSNAEIELSVDSDEVAKISAYRPLADGYTPDWEYSSVESLTVGSWLTDVVCMQGEMLLERERSTRASFAKSRNERASRMNFD